MQTTKLGSTDIDVSIIGLGTVKIGRNLGVKYPKAFTIPEDKDVIHLLNTAGECGINIIDTAPAYGTSEARLGKLLHKTAHPWLIATKAGELFDPATGESSYNFTPEFLQQSVENSLRTLQRDVLDIVLIHSDGNDCDIIQRMGALEVLNHLKQKGLLRASGMSTKTVDGGILAAEQSDVVMVTHNVDYQDELPVIEYARDHHKGVLIKKAFASGHCANRSTLNDSTDPVTESFSCIYQHAGVNSIILGSINPKHIVENAKKASQTYKTSAKANA